jgi:thiamine biosynthesis lipoprotein
MRWLVAGIVALAGGCVHDPSRPAPQRYEYVQLLMGVEVRLVAYAADEAAARAAAKAAFDRVAQLEDIMSDYQNDSELMRLCARAGTGPVKVSPELFEVLDYAQKVSKASDGAFDVSVGPYVRLWRAARKTGMLPTSSALAKARARVGWTLLHLLPERQAVDLTVPGMQLDLGGIGKGYAGDEAIRVLREHGITRALFEAGGDIVVSDPPPGESGWKIEVEDPSIGEPGLLGEPARPRAGITRPGDGPAPPQPAPSSSLSSSPATISLCNAAVSTSGDEFQHVEIAGVRYSHVIDPRSGMALTARYTATVIARRGITSDSISTAASVLGPGAGDALIHSFAARGRVRTVAAETARKSASTTSGTNP